MRKLLFGLLLLPLLLIRPAHADSGILETYPGLQKFVATEHESHLYFGFGVSPFTIVSSKIGFGASLFQLHWIKDAFDFEIFNISFSDVFGQTYGNEQLFLLRTAPKFRLFKNISIGPMAGLEFVHFVDVTDELTKNLKFSKPFEYSTFGAVYGLTASETFSIGSGERANLLKINELVFRENYSSTGTSNGWNYDFLQSSLNSDKSPIAASTVFMIEISFLY